MNYRIVLNTLSRIAGILSLAMLPPYLLSYIFHESNHKHFLIPIIILQILALFYLIDRRSINELRIRESLLIVVAAWLGVTIIGAIPFLLDHIFLNFTDAFFETLSGFTATGSTVLINIEQVPKSVLFWRSETHWLGGMGIVVLAIAIFPSLHVTNKLFSSEAPVSVADDKLFPRISMIAKSYWKVYLLLTLVEVVLLIPAMGWFDAITHSFASIAGGGFSTRNDSIAFFNSLYVEVILIVFMLLGATSFILHFKALHGKFTYHKNRSLKIFIGIILAASLLISVNLVLFQSTKLTIWEALRTALFQVVSIISTTGFATVDFRFWPPFSKLLLLLLMFVGGMAASTSGSIKIWRFEILIKSIKRVMSRALHNKVVTPIHLKGKWLDNQLELRITTFIVAYLCIFVLSGLLLVSQGYNPATSFSAVAATLGNVGPGIGAVGPFDNFAQFSQFAKWILSFDMLLGRLEIWTVLALFIPEFWL